MFWGVIVYIFYRFFSCERGRNKKRDMKSSRAHRGDRRGQGMTGIERAGEGGVGRGEEGPGRLAGMWGGRGGLAAENAAKAENCNSFSNCCSFSKERLFFLFVKRCKNKMNCSLISSRHFSSRPFHTSFLLPSLPLKTSILPDRPGQGAPGT